MTIGVLLALVVGTVIPAVTELLTRETASWKTKAALTAGLSVLVGALSTALVVPPKGTAQWEQLAITVALCWTASWVAYWGAWRPSGAAKKINQATATFGLK